jgi:hypothetical protein
MRTRRDVTAALALVVMLISSQEAVSTPTSMRAKTYLPVIMMHGFSFDADHGEFFLLSCRATA